MVSKGQLRLHISPSFDEAPRGSIIKCGHGPSTRKRPGVRPAFVVVLELTPPNTQN